MAPNPESTRRELVAAAERLFAERGIEAVSLREINRAARQRNATALQYHFGDRRGILRAVLEKHHGGIEAARHGLLDRYEAETSAEGGGALRSLVAALVRPAAAKLADADGGRAYLRIHAQLVNRPDPEFDTRRPPAGDSVERWRRLAEPHLTDVAAHRLHHRFAAIRVTSTELSRRAAARPRRDDQLFTSNLVDLVTALLTAPVSAETEGLLAARH